MLHFRIGMPLYLMALYGSIMIAVVYLLRALLKSRLPKFVFPVLWCLVLVRLLIPFSLSSPISRAVPEIEMPLWESTAVAIVESGTRDVQTSFKNEAVGNVVEDTVIESVTGAATNMVSSFDEMTFVPDWRMVLIAAYGLGVVLIAGVLLYQKYQYAKKLKSSLLIEHNETINTMLRDLGMGHVLVFTNDHIATPFVCGTLRPCIYLPASMDFQDTTLLSHIFAHETMHIKRGDNWLKLAVLVALCINWYNPLVWLMSKCLAADLETACDAGVLGQISLEQRQSYAASLLAMAVTGNRPTMLYSAFSKTEVERRIKNVLYYQKTTAAALIFTIMFLAGSTVAFATVGQAPFVEYLSSFCSSTESRWGVEAEITRDIALGENPQKRANEVILEVLETNPSDDPEIIKEQVKAALAKEFAVEKGAFKVWVNLCLSEEELLKEYASQGITKGQNGLYRYQGKQVRTFNDEMPGCVQTCEDGTADITVIRNRFGEITGLTVYQEGDREYDRRTKELYSQALLMDPFFLHEYPKRSDGTSISLTANAFVDFHVSNSM